MAHPYMMMKDRNNRARMNGTDVVSVDVVPTTQALEPNESSETDIEPSTESAKDKKSQKIRWNDEEMTAVARAARAIRIKDVSITPLNAVRIAQTQVLPPHRHRALHQNRHIKEISALIREIGLTEGVTPPSPSIAEAPEHADAAAPRDPRDAPVTQANENRRHLVRWTFDERRVIALESKRLLGQFDNMTKLEAIRKAVQYALPEERQREIPSIGHVDWIFDEWKAIDEHERAEKQAREAREHALEAERLAEESRREAEAARAEAQAAQAALTVDPATLSFETLIGAIGVKVAGMLMHSIGEHLQESIMQRITEAIGHLPTASLPEGVTRLHPAPRNRKPRVLIVGLLNQQEQDMARAMGEVLALDFVKSEHSNTLEETKRATPIWSCS